MAEFVDRHAIHETACIQRPAGRILIAKGCVIDHTAAAIPIRGRQLEKAQQGRAIQARQSRSTDFEVGFVGVRGDLEIDIYEGFEMLKHREILRLFIGIRALCDDGLLPTEIELKAGAGKREVNANRVVMIQCEAAKDRVDRAAGRRRWQGGTLDNAQPIIACEIHGAIRPRVSFDKVSAAFLCRKEQLRIA